jgi:hypothetical protein
MSIPFLLLFQQPARTNSAPPQLGRRAKLVDSLADLEKRNCFDFSDVTGFRPSNLVVTCQQSNNTRMAMLHLISGLPCSGKSTYAAALRGDLHAVLFSLDRWLIRAFGQYSLESVGHTEHTRRVLACRELIWDAASEFLRRSTDVILDERLLLSRASSASRCTQSRHRCSDQDSLSRYRVRDDRSSAARAQCEPAAV